MKDNRPKTLFYDIETMPLVATTFRLGEQHIRHDSLVDAKHFTEQDLEDLKNVGHDRTAIDSLIYRIENRTQPNQPNIICITYCWEKGPAKALVFDYATHNCGEIIKEFDRIADEADVIIGKNSDKFDRRHINTQRLLTQTYGNPAWMDCSDDLEKQMRKHFMLPSYSLDYFSKLLGFGGKTKMSFSDWYDILYQTKNGQKALDKMVKYGKKDVEDTRAIWQYCEKHFTPRYNVAAMKDDHVCTTCGSEDIFKNGTRSVGKVLKQRWYCNAHGGHAGYTTGDKGKIK
ncbi:MAG: hypothetical protein H7836_16655 [Magnetococcus sp. YQC-3]